MTPYCTNCGSENLRDRGVDDDGDLRLLCDECGNMNFYEPGFSGGHDLNDEIDQAQAWLEEEDALYGRLEWQKRAHDDDFDENRKYGWDG